MLSATLVRLSVRSAVSLRSPLTARFAVSTKQHKATLPFRSFASAASTTRTKSAPSTRKKPASAAGATKKSTRSKSTASTKKKAAAPKKAPKPKKEKLKPWQARGADGKMLPLPSATKPTRRSAFLIFVGDRFPEVRSQPGLMRKSKDGKDVVDLPKVTTSLGQEWKSMSETAKAPYQRRAEEEKVAHELAMERWRANLTTEDIRRQNAYISAQRKLTKPGERRTGKGGARLRDPSKPKGPLSPFMEFMIDFRKSPEAEGVPILELTKKAGATWRELSPSEKQPFELKSQGGREQYLRDIEEWKKSRSTTA